MEKRNKPSAFGLLAMLDKQPIAQQEAEDASADTEQPAADANATEGAESNTDAETETVDERRVPTQWNDEEVDYLIALIRSLVSFFNLQEINETPSISKLMDGGISTEEATTLISYAALLGYEPKLEAVAEAVTTDAPAPENEIVVEAEKGGGS